MLSTDVQKLEQENIELKNEVAALKNALGMEDKEEQACENCKFYIQHYIRHGNTFTRTYDGHCVKGRLKRRKTTESCKLFEYGRRWQ